MSDILLCLVARKLQDNLKLHNIRLICQYPDEHREAFKRLRMESIVDELIALDAARRGAVASAEMARAEQNKLSKQAARVASYPDNFEEFERIRKKVDEMDGKISQLASAAKRENKKLRQRLLEVPNIPYPDVPDGIDESGNKEVGSWGKQRQFDFKPLEHYQINAVRRTIDLKTAAKLCGSRFMVLYGHLARLHRAIAQFMIDLHVDDHGLTEVWTPVIVNNETLQGTGQLPKFATDSYQLKNGKWLIPTGEVTLTNLVSGSIIDEDSLPRRYCAHTQCFRSEAGAAGKDTAGMIRQHQFEKVEMVSITTPETSNDEQQLMLRNAQAVLQKLDLPYRTIKLCTGDLGFAAKRTFDLEVWLPGQYRYREISSVSTCGDFQARRMNARYRGSSGNRRFVHTLNGSGVAVGRAMIAILENGQQRDGSVSLPSVLHQYLGGKTAISSEGNLVE